MASKLAPILKSLVKSIHARSFDTQTLDNLVQKVLHEPHDEASAENLKSQWEYLLKNEIFTLAVRLAHYYPSISGQ
jgi:THO complex subunit 1